MSSSLSRARSYVFPRNLAQGCIEKIRSMGSGGDELFIALAATRPEGEVVSFERAFIPSQICHHLPDGLLVTIDGDSLFELSRTCRAHGLLIAGQIHAHPSDAYHSGADNQLAMTRLPGALSIVVPDFGGGELKASRWSIHRLGEEGHWQELGQEESFELR